MCAALAHRPRLVIADEPTGDLDAESARIVLSLLAELVSEHRASAVVVSHDPASTDIADRVVHIRDGRVSEERHGELGDRRGRCRRLAADPGGDASSGGDPRPREDRRRSTDPSSCTRSTAENATPAPRSARLDGVPGLTLEARRVSRSYGEQVALEGVDATFLPEELSVVVGPSGSGKSTLLALLAGMDVPDEGEVVLGDVVVSSLDRDLTRHAPSRPDSRRRAGSGPLGLPLRP